MTVLDQSSFQLESMGLVADPIFEREPIVNLESNEPLAPSQIHVEVVQGQAIQAVESNAFLPDPALVELGSIGKELVAAVQFRIANENRLRNANRHHPDNTVLHEMIGRHLSDAEGMEKALLKDAVKLAKTIPYIQEMINQPGIGEKSAVKLIAMAGDPIWHVSEERIRTQGEWRSVLGMTPQSYKGPWSNTTRPILWNLAGVSVRMYIDPYRSIYDSYKAEAEGTTHNAECKRCGVLACKYDGCMAGGSLNAPHAGHSRKKVAAQAGDPLSKGHIDARARRVMMSEFADLFYRVRREG